MGHAHCSVMAKTIEIKNIKNLAAISCQSEKRIKSTSRQSSSLRVCFAMIKIAACILTPGGVRVGKSPGKPGKNPGLPGGFRGATYLPAQYCHQTFVGGVRFFAGTDVDRTLQTHRLAWLWPIVGLEQTGLLRSVRRVGY